MMLLRGRRLLWLIVYFVCKNFDVARKCACPDNINHQSILIPGAADESEGCGIIWAIALICTWFF